MASVMSNPARGEWSWPNGRAGLLLLLQAQECASAMDVEIWDFAVEIHELHERGMCDNELRWLLKMKYAEHRIEATLIGDETRCFLPQGGMKFTITSCFVLTLAGECYVRTLLHPSNGSGTKGDGPLSHGPDRAVSSHPLNGAMNGHQSTELPPLLKPYVPPHAAKSHHEASLPGPTDSNAGEIVRVSLSKDVHPTWDEERKELWFGPHLIKRFRFQSPNQEMILAVFHEEGWPAKIDDPLPSVPNQTPRQRLHDAIKNLNRHRLNRLIRFAGDGTGEGVRWEREG